MRLPKAFPDKNTTKMANSQRRMVTFSYGF